MYNKTISASREDYIGEIKTIRYKALIGWPTSSLCAPELEPLIENFTENCITSCKNAGGEAVWKSIVMISKIMLELILHSDNYSFYDDANIYALQKIFDELELLIEEAILKATSQPDEMYNKIDCIMDVVVKNYVGVPYLKDSNDSKAGMIFRKYDSLWKVIHHINMEWESLAARGYSKDLLLYYYRSFEYDRSIGQEKSEKDKLNDLIGLLDGKMKVIPVWKINACAVIPKESDDSPIILLHDEYWEYSLLE